VVNVVAARAMLGPMMMLLAALVLAQATELVEYVDSRGRFRFDYPRSFGSPSAGTDDGFGDRVAAIRFSVFSARLGGEAALTRGWPFIDMQAAGGVYDSIAVGALTDEIRAALLRALPRLTTANFCDTIGRESHVDLQHAAFQSLTPQRKEALRSIDRIRNVAPRVVRCAVNQNIVTFDKEVAFQDGFPRQHVYGAVRFLTGAYSTFQLVRAGAAPDEAVLNQMTSVVQSWRDPSRPNADR
jgi:hypothetical protein